MSSNKARKVSSNQTAPHYSYTWGFSTLGQILTSSWNTPRAMYQSVLLNQFFIYHILLSWFNLFLNIRINNSSEMPDFFPSTRATELFSFLSEGFQFHSGPPHQAEFHEDLRALLLRTSSAHVCSQRFSFSSARVFECRTNRERPRGATARRIVNTCWRLAYQQVYFLPKRTPHIFNRYVSTEGSLKQRFG